MNGHITLVLAAAMAGSAAAGDDTQIAASENAALYYFRACGMIGALSEQLETLDKSLFASDAPMDDRTVEALAPFAPALYVLRLGAAQPTCDWGYPPGLLATRDSLPHFGGLRSLTALLGAQAQFALAQGRFEEGTRDFCAVMAVGRHLSSERLLISSLVGWAIEQRAIVRLAENLPRLRDTGQMDVLAQRFSQLPKPVLLVDALRGERDVFSGWQLERLRQGDRDAVTKALEAAGLPEPDRSTQQLIQEAEGWYEAMTRLAEMAELPLDEHMTEARKLMERAKAADPRSQALASPLSAGAVTAARLSTSRRMLEAAIAYERGGMEAFKGIADPYGDGPFEFGELGDGTYRISSALGSIVDMPVTLTIGRPGDGASHDQIHDEPGRH